MPRSQNGYSANDQSIIASYLVPGTNRKLALRKGDTSVILLDFAARFHREVQSIDTGGLDDWGFAKRPIRGQTVVLSNHASGTAMDLNATLHPLAKRGTFSPTQVAKIHALLKLYGGAVRWGGDYHGRCDEMHFEIVGGAAACKVVADKIRAGKLAPSKAPAKQAVPVKSGPPAFPGTTLTTALGKRARSDVKTWQTQMNHIGRNVGIVDGKFGKQCAAQAQEFRRHLGIKPVIGEVDKRTWDATWIAR